MMTSWINDNDINKLIIVEELYYQSQAACDHLIVTCKFLKIENQKQEATTSQSGRQKSQCSKCTALGHNAPNCYTTNPAIMRKNVAANQKWKKAAQPPPSLPFPPNPLFHPSDYNNYGSGPYQLNPAALVVGTWNISVSQIGGDGWNKWLTKWMFYVQMISYESHMPSL